MIKRSRETSRGFVLLVALGVLGVLGLLAATFATLSRVERAVSNSYVDKVRAKMLAQSGVERAIASIRGRAMVQSWDDVRNDWYYREMLNAEAGTLVYPATVKTDIWKFTPTRAYGMPARSLEFAVDDGIVNGTANGISFPQTKSASANEPFSGEFPGTYEPRGDVYALKVLDCASMLNVNDGSTQIVRVLNNLGAILKCSDGSLVSAGGFQLGTQIQTKAVARAKPFNNKAEVLDEVFIKNSFFASTADARKRFDAVKDFITCHGWIDGMTIRFNNTWTGTSDYTGGSYASAIAGTTTPVDGPKYAGTTPEEPLDLVDPADVKLASSDFEFAASPLFNVQAVVPGAYASLPSTRMLAAPAPAKAKDVSTGGGFKQYVTGKGDTAAMGGETAAGKFGGTYYYGEPRCPININTVSKEVLVAALQDVEADFWDYLVVSESASPKEYNANLGIINVKITKAQAEAAADYLLAGRFTHGTPAGAWSYNDWMHFEDEVIFFIPSLSRFQKALIKSVANPNTNIKKLCPDLILVTSEPSVDPDELVRMDKSDVKVGSLDWSFSSNGFFEIECIGRVYNSGRIMAEEKIETVVKVYDQVVYTTQEQLEKDRSWTTEDSKEGDLDAGGYPPVISMPEYVYNGPSKATHYRSRLGDVTWAADYEGYLILNGPTKVAAGQSPGPAANPSTSYGSDATKACWGPDKTEIKGAPLPPAAVTNCGVSFVAGFNLGSLYPNQSHRHAWHDAAAGGFGGTSGGPRHPEYAYTSPHCFADGGSMTANPAHSFIFDQPPDQKSAYGSAYGAGVLKPYQIEPTAAVSGWSWGGGGGVGANYWDNGTDLQNFGIYINWLRRNRFHTYWADEVPNPNCTIEMTVKPEVDLWNWATKSKLHSVSSMWGGGYTIWPCSRMFLFDWGTGGTQMMNYTVRLYAQLSRIYLEFYHHATAKLHVMYANHSWKAHTWHHVEVSWVPSHDKVLSTGTVLVPPNAMLFVDGSPATTIATSGQPLGQWDVNSKMAQSIYTPLAMVLPQNVHPTTPNADVGTGPRFDVGSTLANDGSFGMSSPRWIGLIDNIVMHHWRSHETAFTPRNRYHSTTYYDGAAFKSGEGYKGEKSGVYKKKLTYLENLAMTRTITIGTLGCTHYHPFHVHLYGHDGAAPTTAFGHITPALRIKTGASFIDQYYYDGCVGVPIKAQVPTGAELYYLGWFEIASLVPVTMSPILCDIRITFFDEPSVYYRLSSSEAKK
jgi:hypothetical protein